MCSICGFFPTVQGNYDGPLMERIANACRERGKDSWGLAIQNHSSFSLETFIDEVPTAEHFKRSCCWMMLNMRAEPTTEWVNKKTAADIQPFRHGDIIVAHNGTIANDKELLGTFTPPTKIDTYALAFALSNLPNIDFKSLKDFFRNSVTGSYAVAIGNRCKQNELWLVNNFKPLYLMETVTGYYFASQEAFLKNSFPHGNVQRIPEYSITRLSRAGGVIRVQCQSLFVDHPKKALIVCSAGLDSTVAAKMYQQLMPIELVHFRYSCRAQLNEEVAIARIAEELNCPLTFVNTDIFKSVIGGSRLTDTAATLVTDNEGMNSAEFCLSGNTVVYLDGKHQTTYRTLEELHRGKSVSGSWQKAYVRTVDKDGKLTKARIGDIIYNGKKLTYEIVTGAGYTIRATDNHRFIDAHGKWKALSEFSVGDAIAVNGTMETTRKCICGCKTDIPLTQHCVPGHMLGPRNPHWKGDQADPECAYQRHKTTVAKIEGLCEMCNEVPAAQRSHFDGNPYNNTKENIKLLCCKCHVTLDKAGLHAVKRAMTFDIITHIEPYTVEDVYDLHILSDEHNFVANGFVVHNCHEWVPARNMIMLSIATGIAESRKCTDIVLGNNLEEAGCVTGDTRVSCKRADNYFDWSIKELYEREVLGMHWGVKYNSTIPTLIRSMLPDGTCQYVEIEKVFHNGMKEVFEVTLENGYSLTATAEHEWFTSDGYVRTDKLELENLVYSNGVRYPNMTEAEYASWRKQLSDAKRGDKNPNKQRANADKIRRTLNLKTGCERLNEDGYITVSGMSFHPYGGVANKIYQHRLIVEASLNKASYQDWVVKCMGGDFDGSEKFLDPTVEVHHKDNDKGNNRLDNLQVVTPSMHQHIHHEVLCIPRRIIRIISRGIQDTYDVAVSGTGNYLANKICVHNSYPDNEPEFINRLNQVMPYAVHLPYKLSINMPVGNMMKREIVKKGLEIGAPLHLTWSCYESGDYHCGTCGPCYMRKTAFKMNNTCDPVFAHEVSAKSPYWEGCIKYESR